MDFMTILGAAVGSGVIFFILSTGNMTRFLLNPEAIILIFGGTLGSVLISYPWSVLRHAPGGLMMMLRPPRRPTPQLLIGAFVKLGESALRDGPQSLAASIPGAPHPFLADGLQMLIDGLDAEVMRERFERDILATRQRHLQICGIFRSAGTYAPIFGLLGTLIGVVQVLRNITDPTAMGSSMAVAMTASFYGIFSANFLFLPIATKLNFYSEEEMLNRELIAKGVVALFHGEAPWLISRKLEGYMSYYLRRDGAKKYRAGA
ncbi:MAG: MotA/TolQ/ExbB proton channel family protein [Elusimicrobia bacterium]|nr:MotA/TolQ/ExbB proton channel family protein [Elusimicrobiota bacterium]